MLKPAFRLPEKHNSVLTSIESVVIMLSLGGRPCHVKRMAVSSLNVRAGAPDVAWHSNNKQ